VSKSEVVTGKVILVTRCDVETECDVEVGADVVVSVSGKLVLVTTSQTDDILGKFTES